MFWPYDTANIMCKNESSLFWGVFCHTTTGRNGYHDTLANTTLARTLSLYFRDDTYDHFFKLHVTKNFTFWNINRHGPSKWLAPHQPIKRHVGKFLFTDMDFNVEFLPPHDSMSKSMLASKDFLTCLLIGWGLCSQPIKHQV